MPARNDDVGRVHEVDRWEHGAGWMAHPDEEMQRASHALVCDGDVWVVDPVDAEGLDGWLADLGDVVGVVALSSYHARDAGKVAARHGVSVTVPAWDDRLSDLVMAPIEPLAEGERLPGTEYELRFVYDDSVWSEGALWNPENGTLVCTESLATAPYLTCEDERLGVSAFRRLSPPRAAFVDIEPDRILVGHGEGVHEDATGALRDALAGARRRAPRYFLGNLPALARTLRAAVLD